MRFRLVPVAVLLAACVFSGSFAGTPAGVVPKPWTPKPGTAPVAPAAPKHTLIINGIPDTGQFLPDTTWLVQVGPRITRASDYVREYLGAYPVDRPKEDSLGRVEFMNTIINHDLLGLTARALNQPLDFTDRATLREAEERTLSDAFFVRFVADSARVSDDEVAEYARQRGEEGHFRHILFADHPTAERIRGELAGHKLKWEEAVKQYSMVKPTAQNPDGDMGWVKHSDLPAGIALSLFRLQPGDVSGVFFTDQGYEVSQLVAFRRNPAPDTTALLSFVRKNLLDYHISVRADSIQTLIRDQIGMVFDTANVNFACSHMGKPMVVTHEASLTNVQVASELPEFTPEDTARVLARWNGGGHFSFGQLIGWYNSMNPMVRPNVTFPDGMTAQISGVVLEPYRATLARERGLDKDPEVIARIEDKRERLMVEHMYQDSVASKFWVSKDERKAYYASHMTDYITFASVDFALISRHNRASIDSLKRVLDAGADPAAIIAADSARGERTGYIEHRGQNETAQYHKVVFEELHPGQSTIIGPDRTGTYAVIKLLRYDPGHQLSFEESQGMIDESLQSIKADEVLNAWLARLRKRYPVVSRPELVMRVLLLDKSAL